MIPSRGLRPSSHIFKGFSHRLPATARGRNFTSTGRQQPSTRPNLHASPPHRALWPSPRCISQLRVGLQASRFASTVPTVPTDATPAVPEEVPTEEFIPPSIEDLTSGLPLISEKIGYLKEIGLDFGWGPTAFIEYLLEHVHIYTATPWWASIVLTALIVRLVLLKAYISAADVSARMSTITDLQKPIKARMDAAKATRDREAVVRATEEIRALHREAGIQLWKLGVPLLQIPIGYGTFRLLRRMSDLPVPGLEDGGFLWMKDLTMSDPYMIMPAITGAFLYYTFKAGGELGNNAMSPAMYKFGLYGMPVIGGGFMLMYPACLQLTFGFTAALSLIQSYLLRQPWIRERIGIYPLPKRKPDSNGPGAVAARLQVYQPPPQTTPDVEVKIGVTDKAKRKVSEVGGAVSEFKKSMTEMVKQTKTDAANPPPASAELAKAQQLQQKRLNQLAHAQYEAEQRKHGSAAERQKKSGARR